MARDAEKSKEANKRYYEKHRESRIAAAIAYRNANREAVKEYNKEYSKRPHVVAKLNVVGANHRARLKAEVLAKYSDGSPRCVRCGFDDVRALSIDHIDGSGCMDRRESRRSGIAMYRWLKQTGFPPNYQTLCMNCQFIKRSENEESNLPGPRREWPSFSGRVAAFRLTKTVGTTQYQGVSLARGKLSVRIAKDGKTYWLGTFPLGQEVEAARNYDFHAINLYGREGGFLNFPDYDYSFFSPRRPLR